MRILIAYASLSGNTKEVAFMIRERCQQQGHRVTWLDVFMQTLPAADARDHDIFLLGT